MDSDLSIRYVVMYDGGQVRGLAGLDLEELGIPDEGTHIHSTHIAHT